MTPTDQAIEAALEAATRAVVDPARVESKKAAAVVFRAAITAALSADLGDMALVPKKPTDTMIDAGLDERGGGHDQPRLRSMQAAEYCAMIAAA